MHRRWQREEVQSELWADNLQGHRRGSSLPMVQVIEQGFAYGRQSSHLPPSTHSEALLSLQKIFPPALSIHFTLLPSVPFLLPPILVVCSARVWFLGVLHSCTLLLHWEMPYPLPLTNVHCGNDIGFKKKKNNPQHGDSDLLIPCLLVLGFCFDLASQTLGLNVCQCLIWQCFGLKKHAFYIFFHEKN